MEEDEYIEYGIILVLILVLVWLYFQKASLQSLYDQSISAQKQLGVQLSTQATADNLQIAGSKQKIDDLNSQIALLKPKADELDQHKLIISSNLYASLQASDALFGTSTNPQILQAIAKATADVATKAGMALCDVAQILAKVLMQAYDANAESIGVELCKTINKAHLVSQLNNDGNFAGSQIVTMISGVFDLFQAYFCTNQTRENLIKIVSALVNVICNPSNESKQLFTALYKQVLFDLDKNYKTGSASLNENPGVYTKPQIYPQPSYNDGTYTYPAYNHTVPGYYRPAKTGDPFVDKLAASAKINI